MTLSKCEIDHFIEHGYTFIRNSIPIDFIDQIWGPRKEFLSFIKGFEEETHLYFPRIGPLWDVEKVSSRLDKAISQLIGGESKSSKPRKWGDGFVVARPLSKIYRENSNNPANNYHWHKDGFHRHFLDSPEIGVIALVMWTDLTEENGATVIADKSIEIVAGKLAAHPEGLEEDFFDKNTIINTNIVRQTRITGEAGDVCLMHPMLLHSTMPNLSEDFRAITNPVVPLIESMKFKRADGCFSPVELAILNALGVESLDFVASGIRGKSMATEISGKFDKMRASLRKQIEEYEVSKGRHISTLWKA